MGIRARGRPWRLGRRADGAGITMSDRKNRDRGQKNANRRGKWECSCWLCISDREKKRRVMEKSGKDRRYLGVVEELG
jgi:hypothetical protein